MGRPRKQQAEILMATDSGSWTSPDGAVHDFYAGRTTARAGSAIAKAMPQCFAPIHVDYDVEQLKSDTERWHGEDTEVRVHA